MAEPAALSAPLVSVEPAPPEAASPRWRSIVAAVLGVLAVLLLTVTIVAVWARATVIDRDNFTSLVSAGLEEPEVQAGLAAYATAELFSVVDVTSVVNDVLPDRLDRLTPTIVNGAESTVEGALERAIATPQVQNLLTDLVGRAHDAAMRLLQGDGLGDGITVENGVVTLNLVPLMQQGLEALQANGFLEGVTIPDLTNVSDPEEQRSRLATAIGQRLPDDFGQLVVYQSDSLAEAQESVERVRDTLAVAKRALWLIIVLAAVFFVATIVVAPRRWRALLFLGVGTAATMSLLRITTRQVVDEAPSLAQRPGGRAAIDAVLREASSSLLRWAGIVLLIAIVMALVGMARRGWQRADFVLLAAVVVGTSVVALAEISVVSIVVGILAGLAVPLADHWLRTSRQPKVPEAQVPAAQVPAAPASGEPG